MDSTQFETIRQTKAIPVTLSVAEVGTEERTLTYGWLGDVRGTFHVYVKDGLIHAFLYDTYEVSPDGGSGVYKVDALWHISGEVLAVSDLHPRHSAYPEKTDAHFAVLMAERGAAIEFTPYDEKRYEATKNRAFLGEVLR